MRFVRNSLALALVCLALLSGCEGLSVDTVKRVAEDVAGSGDTGTAAEDTADDVADTAPDTAPDTAADTDTSDTGVAAANGCGGTEALAYRGAAASPGDACGLCGDGELYCSGTGGLSCAGATLPNDCGGCGLVEGEIGTTCGLCGDGVWACGAGQSECVGDRPPNGCGGCTTLALEPGTECALATGDAGVVVCSGRELSRCASAGTNGCGGTAPLTLPAGVTGVEPRPGVLYQSDCRRGVLLCDGAALVAVDLEGGNACGGCDPLLGEPGSECGACGGVWTCDAEGGVRCIGGSANACGGCAALDAGPGRDCDAGGNAGVTVCISLEETTCVPPGSTNACGGLGTITGDPLGQSCGACADGAVACDVTDALRRTTVCEGASDLNSCGGCGLLDGTVGSACGTCGSGSFACSATSLVCINDAGAAAENVCGGCSTLAANPGDPCGRCGTWSCDPSATGRLACTEPAGGCGPARVDDLGFTCPMGCNLELCIDLTSDCTAACAFDGRRGIDAYCTQPCTDTCPAGYTCLTADDDTGNFCFANPAVCGNGAVEAGEGCDDGNTVTEECAYADLACTVCSASCQSVAGATAFCGDGLLDAVEVCDAGSANGSGACSVGCTCSAGYHLEGGVCTSDDRACSVPNGTGSETWTGSSYGACVLQECLSGFHAEAVVPVGTFLAFNSGSSISPLTSSAPAWRIDALNGRAAPGALKSGVTPNSGTTTVTLAVTGAARPVSFWYRVSSEADYDYLRFIVDGTERGSWSGTVGWTQLTTSLTAGAHTLLWRYAKDSSGAAGSDAAWIDDLEIGDPSDCGALPCGTTSCLSDSRACSLPNATAATETWTGSSYGTCTATACATDFAPCAGNCVPIGNSLGSACACDAECASGFCATGPAGTANDRCAPEGMNYIPAGTFIMGSPSGEMGRDANEAQHNVTITRSFFTGQTEVTQGQWKALSGGLNPSCFQSTTSGAYECTTRNANDSGPAEQMNWYAAVAFANARSAAEGLARCYTLMGCTDAANGWQDGIHSGCTGATFSGLTCTGYRLPTESEWEYAARAGTTTAAYGGNLSATDGCVTLSGTGSFAAGTALGDLAWYDCNAASRTQPTGGKLPNAFGLSDVLGNVQEWTADFFDSTYPGSVTDPTGPPMDTGGRVTRGGSFSLSAVGARVSFRGLAASWGRGVAIGFRLARTAP